MSVNMRRHNAMTHALLQDSDFDIIAIQEPWFGKIHTDRSNSNPSGTPIYGGVFNDLWHCIHPTTIGNTPFKTALYLKSSLLDTLSVIHREHNPLSSASSMVIDLTLSPLDTLCIVNIYHDVPDRGHGLHHLFCSSLDPSIPTLVVGDFNTHSPLWSLPTTRPSPWGTDLETWFADNQLLCLNPEQVITWQGPLRHTPSVLDLFLLNSAALSSDTLQPPSISFDLSLGSDHAALCSSWSTSLEPDYAHPVPTTLPGFVLDDDLKDQWLLSFTQLPTPPITDLTSTCLAASRLHEDILETSALLFKPRKAPDPRGARWWNDDCLAALRAYKACPPEEKPGLYAALRHTITKAKRNSANEFLDHCNADNLWKATRWRKGHQLHHIPPLSDNGTCYSSTWAGF
jgi:Endonuclease-reverse transcriptase